MQYFAVWTFVVIMCGWAQAESDPLIEAPQSSPASPATQLVEPQDAASQNSSARFEETGTGLLHDTTTGLLWTQTDSGMGYSWPDAQAYCDGLKTETCTDWRLPSIEELLALRDPESNGEPKMTPQFQLTKQWLWSATEETQGSAWYFHVEYGTQRQARTDSSDIHVLCVCVPPDTAGKDAEQSSLVP